MPVGEHRLHYLRAAGKALANYDIGEVRIDESKASGPYRLFRLPHGQVPCSRGKSGSFLVSPCIMPTETGTSIDYRTAINSHLLWIEALNRDTDLLVQRPVRSVSGDFFTDVESDNGQSFLVTLLRWVEGELVWDNYGDELFVDLPSGILLHKCRIGPRQTPPAQQSVDPSRKLLSSR